MADTMHKIEFTVPLSGSKLFDTFAYATAKNLCAEFPGLNYDYEDKTKIQITGELNDYWFEKWNQRLFTMGN